jgi:hypothetical protein
VVERDQNLPNIFLKKITQKWTDFVQNLKKGIKITCKHLENNLKISVLTVF